MDPVKLETIYKIALILIGVGGLFIPVIIAIIGVVFVRKNQRRKEEAEAKLTESQAKLTETQLNKIQKEAKDVISGIINEPTIKDITQGYQNLMSNFKCQIEELQNENKRIRTDFNSEIELLKKQIETLRQENKQLRNELENSESNNKDLKKKIDLFIKKTNKKNKQKDL